MRIHKEQRRIIKSIAKELGVPRNEVLFLMIEFGMMVCVMSQEEEFRDTINKKFGHLPEYKNWEAIADEQYKYWKAGEKPTVKT